MSTPHDGGQAFPDLHATGMSVRTYIATAAMAALLSREDTHIYGSDQLARLAYQQADALIAAGEAK